MKRKRKLTIDQAAIKIARIIDRARAEAEAKRQQPAKAA